MARGFFAFGGHSLRTPENYPPMLALHMGFADQPKPGVMRRFDEFIGGMARMLDKLERGESVEPRAARIGLLGVLSPARPRTAARVEMGEKAVDAALCTECGLCERECPYGAIELAPKPVFDQVSCYGCWRCYNRCPQHAIHTRRFRGGPYYAGPSDRARRTLSVG